MTRHRRIAIALAGWCLLGPPVRDSGNYHSRLNPSEPLANWINWRNPAKPDRCFAYLTTCQAWKKKAQPEADKLHAHPSEYMEHLADSFDAAECISTDDPRLKKSSHK
jgi:hypothetical protein